MAVDLAKLSLWLATLAKDHPFTFLDHALRPGDSLVGLTRKQIAAFHWAPEVRKLAFMPTEQIANRIGKVAEFRREIREAAEGTAQSLLNQKWELAEEALNPLRFYADLIVAALFDGSNDKARKSRLEDLAEGLAAYLANPITSICESPSTPPGRHFGKASGLSRRFIGRSSFRRFSAARMPGSMRLSATRPLRVRTRWPRGTSRDTPTGSSRSTKSHTATRTSSPTSSGEGRHLGPPSFPRGALVIPEKMHPRSLS
jgi:hypothetical protein